MKLFGYALYFIIRVYIMQVRDKPLKQLERLFSQKKCWRIDELHQLLNYSIISIRGFLKQVGYFSSFTHNNKWYTLSYLPVFDKNGLWFYEAIGFSKHGNLKKSILYFINKSPKGLSAEQLAELLLTVGMGSAGSSPSPYWWRWRAGCSASRLVSLPSSSGRWPQASG